MASDLAAEHWQAAESRQSKPGTGHSGLGDRPAKHTERFKHLLWRVGRTNVTFMKNYRNDNEGRVKGKQKMWKKFNHQKHYRAEL